MSQLHIKNGAPVQENFLGNGAIYHGYAGMPDDAGRVYSEELCALEAARAADMKLKIARTFYTWWAWDEAKQVWNWENEVMQCFYRWLQRMKDSNITVALNAGWCSPGDLNGNGWTNKEPFSKCPFIVSDDWTATVQNYADWVSETVHQLIELRGFTNIKILVMFTESEGDGRYAKSRPYECWRDSVEAAHAALVRDGRRGLVKLMGPNEASIPGESSIGVPGEMLQWAVENTQEEVIDIFSCHVYPFARPLNRKYLKTGKAAVGMTLAGGRFCRTIPLRPNTKYTLCVDLLFEPNGTEPAEGAVHFGLFLDDGRNDVLTKGGPAEPAAEGSRRSLTSKELSAEYQRFTCHFDSGDATSGVVGVFYDMRTPGMTCVDQLLLTEEGSEENQIPNGDFSDYTDGWCLLYATGSVDLYEDWYYWAKCPLQHVPKHKQYCYDEYNASYDHDFSRPSHGAEVATAAIAFMNAGAQFSLMWTLFDQQWPNNHVTNQDCFVDGDHRYGVMPILTRSRVPHLSYYAFSLISKYIDGGGTKVYEGVGKDCLHTTMAVSKEGEITIIVVNNKEAAESFTLTLDHPIHATLNRHAFDPAMCIPDETATIIGADRAFAVTDTLCDTIVPYGVSVYTTCKDEKGAYSAK